MSYNRAPKSAVELIAVGDELDLFYVGRHVSTPSQASPKGTDTACTMVTTLRRANYVTNKSSRSITCTNGAPYCRNVHCSIDSDPNVLLNLDIVAIS